MNCPEQSPGACDGAPCRAQGQKRRCMSAVEQGSCPDGDPAADWEVEEEEDEDRFLGVLLRRSCALRASFRERDSYRRHSWEPGKKLQSAPDYDQMRYPAWLMAPSLPSTAWKPGSPTPLLPSWHQTQNLKNVLAA